VQVQEVHENPHPIGARRIDDGDGICQGAHGGEAHELEAHPDSGRCGPLLELHQPFGGCARVCERRDGQDVARADLGGGVDEAFALVEVGAHADDLHVDGHHARVVEGASHCGGGGVCPGLGVEPHPAGRPAGRGRGAHETFGVGLELGGDPGGE
jgi:hypothetical protein